MSPPLPLKARRLTCHALAMVDAPTRDPIGRRDLRKSVYKTGRFSLLTASTAQSIMELHKIIVRHRFAPSVSAALITSHPQAQAIDAFYSDANSYTGANEFLD